MIKKERGVITYMSQEINNLARENTVGGMHLVQNLDEKLAEKMQNKSDKNLENGAER